MYMYERQSFRTKSEISPTSDADHFLFPDGSFCPAIESQREDRFNNRGFDALRKTYHFATDQFGPNWARERQ